VKKRELTQEEYYALEERRMVRQSRMMIDDGQSTIEIQRLITIGTVKTDEDGSRPMVVEAFSLAGDYLNGRAGNDGESDAVQFTYLGVTFHASCEVKSAVEVPTDPQT
jgi:hypothetical protein